MTVFSKTKIRMEENDFFPAVIQQDLFSLKRIVKSLHKKGVDQQQISG